MQQILNAAALAVVAVVAAGFTALGYWSTVHAVRKVVRWPKVPAELLRYWVVRNEDKPSGRQFFRPVLQFTTSDGREVITISSSQHWRRPWPLGHVVSVRYQPENPLWAETSNLGNWALSLFSFAVAAILGGVVYMEVFG
jgi:hypothetical protein